MGCEANRDLAKNTDSEGGRCCTVLYERGGTRNSEQSEDEWDEKSDLPRGEVPTRSTEEMPAPALLRSHGRKPALQRQRSSSACWRSAVSRGAEGGDLFLFAGTLS
jgi:hypothetical protein